MWASPVQQQRGINGEHNSKLKTLNSIALVDFKG